MSDNVSSTKKVVVLGPPFSGKSTFCEQLTSSNREINWDLIEIDLDIGIDENYRITLTNLNQIAEMKNASHFCFCIDSPASWYFFKYVISALSDDFQSIKQHVIFIFTKWKPEGDKQKAIDHYSTLVDDCQVPSFFIQWETDANINHSSARNRDEINRFIKYVRDKSEPCKIKRVF